MCVSSDELIMKSNAGVRVTILFLSVCIASQAGLLIVRNGGKDLQFPQAISVNVNGKDKALGLGNQPKLTGPVGKLRQVHLNTTLLKERESDTMLAYEGKSAVYLFPANGPKNATGTPGENWKAAKLSYKKSASDKVPVDVPTTDFIAFLPEGVEELARLCTNESALEIIGGKGKAFIAQLELLKAAVNAFPADPAMAPVEKYVRESMRSRYEDFENSSAGLDVFKQALKIAELSQVAYPNEPEHVRLRKALADREGWLDKRTAILRAFSAGGQWDAFLLGDRDFERYHNAFPELMKTHLEALRESLQLHRQAGEERLKAGDYGNAFREFRLAGARQPSDSNLQQRTLMAWTDYSRQVAIDQQGKRKQLSAGQREAINQALLFATRYKEENKLDLALKMVLEGERVDKESLSVLLKKAEILGHQREFTRALAALDEYDKHALDEERQKASQLRNELMFQRTSSLEDLKSQLATAWADSAFNRVRHLALQGLRAKEDDADLLYHAGMASFITRERKDSRQYLARYLDVSNTLDVNAEQRKTVRRLLPFITDIAPAEKGDPNWMSGKRLPANVYYCPISLAFQPKVDRVDASNKLKETFEWDGNRLGSITPSFDKPEHATGEKKMIFGYEASVPQVASVGYDSGARTPPVADQDEALKRSSLVILNNPSADPVAIQRLTGKNVTIGIAGNQFFHPFIWEKIHYFRLTYDGAGRVSQALSISDPKSATGNVLVEFEWQGLQLQAVHGYQLRDGDIKNKEEMYVRRMQYQDGRLVSEDIQSQGKTSRIRYTYSGDRLVSANCDKDPTIDGRSRQVTFLAR